MGFKELIQNIGKGQKDRKEMIRQLDEQMRIEKLVHDRTLSSNERELNKFNDEEREEQIKGALEVMRKKRKEDIAFNHNPINAKNIMKAEWEVMKEKNQFAGRTNMFKGQEFIHKSNKKLLNSGNVLHNNGNILKQNSNILQNERGMFLR